MNSLNSNSRALENAFFLAEDRVLIEKLSEMRKLKETKESLSKVSGISSDAVLEKLIKLGIQTETVASLAVIPLIEVAWADGSVDAKEKAAILKSLNSPQFPNSIDTVLVERWLSHHPGPELIEAWIHYSQSLASELGPEEKKTLRDELVSHARLIAEASGGILGIGSISPAEKAMLERLSKAWE